jgi:hypothetical protein
LTYFIEIPLANAINTLQLLTFRSLVETGKAPLLIRRLSKQLCAPVRQGALDAVMFPGRLLPLPNAEIEAEAAQREKKLRELHRVCQSQTKSLL